MVCIIFLCYLVLCSRFDLCKSVPDSFLVLYLFLSNFSEIYVDLCCLLLLSLSSLFNSVCFIFVCCVLCFTNQICVSLFLFLTVSLFLLHPFHTCFSSPHLFLFHINVYISLCSVFLFNCCISFQLQKFMFFYSYFLPLFYKYIAVLFSSFSNLNFYPLFFNISSLFTPSSAGVILFFHYNFRYVFLYHLMQVSVTHQLFTMNHLDLFSITF